MTTESAVPDSADQPKDQHGLKGDDCCSVRPSVSPGTAIEVRWDIEDDNEIERVWWSAMARIPAEQEAASSDHDIGQVLALDYKCYRGFDAETRHVVFLTDHALLDVESGDEMIWRYKGDSWDTDAEGGAESEQDMVQGDVSIQELAEIVDSDLGEHQDELEQTFNKMYRSWTPAQQINMAAGYRSFAEHLKQQLKGLQQQQGAEGGKPLTVTREHIEQIMASIPRPQ